MRGSINASVSGDSQCLCGDTDSFVMSLFVLLLLVSGTQAGFYGGVVSYITKDLQGGLYQVRFHLSQFLFLCLKTR